MPPARVRDEPSRLERLQAVDVLEVQEDTPVDPLEEIARQALLEIGERVVGEIRPPLGHDGHELSFEDRVADRARIEEHDPLPRRDRQSIEPAGRRLGGVGRRRRQVRAVSSRQQSLPRAPEGLLEAPRLHGLHHVVRGPELEGLHRVIRVRRAEDDDRSFFRQELQRLQAGEPRHVDVEQDHVDVLGLQALEDSAAALALSGDGDPLHRREQTHEALSGEELVVGHEDAHGAHHTLMPRSGPPRGSSISTRVRSPLPVMRKEAPPA